MKHKLKNAPPDTKRHVNYGRCLYAAFLAVTVLCGYTQPVFAATIWTKANEIMKDVYNQIILISTIAAVVTASVALLPEVRLSQEASYPAGLPGQWEDRYKEKRSIPQPVIPNTAVSETCSTSHP